MAISLLESIGRTALFSDQKCLPNTILRKHQDLHYFSSQTSRSAHHFTHAWQNRNVLDLPNIASQEGKQKEKRSPRRSAPLLHTKLEGFVGPYRLRTAPLSLPHPLPVADSMPARPSAAAAAAHLDFLPIKVVLFSAKRGGVICLLPRQPLDPTFRSRNRMT
ncbi:hypothetical protein Cni_G10522 [Canna indica]|uniref:Uncharacterized protein n=1 Tax=Canna indica TaxID=4628 RepID=A0AAQ3K679_9LILI|nr:hypothetical protein Cni_G10522 [Canna indica]